MKKLVATAIVALTALTAQPAMAWGDREQGILTGVLGTLILQDINRRAEQPVIHHPQPRAVHVQQQPQVIIQQQYPQDCGYHQNIFYNGAYKTIEKRDRCTGELIERRTERRY